MPSDNPVYITIVCFVFKKVLLKYKFSKLKDLGVSPQTLKIFWKKFSKTFGKMQFHCIFCKSINGNFIIKTQITWLCHGILVLIIKFPLMDLQKMQWNCILSKVLLNFFQKIFGVWGKTQRSFSSINFYFRFIACRVWDIVPRS